MKIVYDLPDHGLDSSQVKSVIINNFKEGEEPYSPIASDVSPHSVDMGLLKEGLKPLIGQTRSYLGFSDFNSKKLMRMQTVAESKEIPNLNDTYTHTTTTNQPVNNSILHINFNSFLESSY